MKRILLLTFLLSNLFSSELTEEQKRELGNQAIHDMMQKIWTRAMEAKEAYQNGLFNTREEYLENVCSTAPVAMNFSINADVSNELESGDPSAEVFISWDGQSSWDNYPAIPLDPEVVGSGYENTWAAGTESLGDMVDWYLAGTVNSEALGYDYGTILLSGSPHNTNQYFPLTDNMYGLLASDASGDAASNQDILSIMGSYYDDGVVDDEGTSNGAEQFYLAMNLNGGCCDEEAGFFGPWYLYGVGIVNPDSEEAVAYAVGYGNGGFGQLTPGIYKISGDLTTGDIDGFENIGGLNDYDTGGNTLQVVSDMSDITNDSQWGEWPNSVYGFIGLGVTVSAALDGLDVAADILDETSPGLFIMNATHQEGNTNFELSDLAFDSDNMVLSATYSDADGNFPWFKSMQICNPDGSNCFINEIPVPDSHTYEDGVIFSAYIGDSEIPDGDYAAKFAFADGEYNPDDVQYLDITFGSGGGCAEIGDVNEDTVLNILDVVLLVNLILSGSEVSECGDANDDGFINILDVVLLVNLILAG